MNTETLQLAIIALIAGMAVPLLVQLFRTARTVQRVAGSADRKLEEARRELHDLIAGSRREPGAGRGPAAQGLQ
jgi:type II secretory pathway pseudopilin PulG